MSSTLQVTILISLLSFIVLFILIYFSGRSINYNNKMIKIYNDKKEIDDLIELKNYKKRIMSIVDDIRVAVNNYNLSLENLEEIDRLTPIVLTGRASVDSLLNSKIKICKRKNINFTYIIEDIDFSNIKNDDIIPLLGNLIDNSIEASLHSLEKDVKLVLKVVKNYYVIKITNTKDSGICPLKTNFKTTKEDAIKHGLGTKIIKLITNKYKGKISYSDKGNEFVVSVIIPV
jgi:signal transduction histidine kinase